MPKAKKRTGWTISLNKRDVSLLIGVICMLVALVLLSGIGFVTKASKIRSLNSQLSNANDKIATLQSQAPSEQSQTTAPTPTTPSYTAPTSTQPKTEPGSWRCSQPSLWFGTGLSTISINPTCFSNTTDLTSSLLCSGTLTVPTDPGPTGYNYGSLNMNCSSSSI